MNIAEASLILSAVLFVVGAAGVLLRRNAIVIFMSIELMLNAVNLSFVVFARQWGVPAGGIFALFVMVVAAAEAPASLNISNAVDSFSPAFLSIERAYESHPIVASPRTTRTTTPRPMARRFLVTKKPVLDLNLRIIVQSGSRFISLTVTFSVDTLIHLT